MKSIKFKKIFVILMMMNFFVASKLYAQKNPNRLIQVPYIDLVDLTEKATLSQTLMQQNTILKLSQARLQIKVDSLTADVQKAQSEASRYKKQRNIALWAIAGIVIFVLLGIKFASRWI